MKYIEIDSLDDLQPLFEELCSAIKMKELDVKRLVLGFKGAEFAVKSRQVTFNDILGIVEKRKMKFNLKISYDEFTSLEEEMPELSAPSEGMKQSDVSRQMEKQKEEINPELLPEHVTQFGPPLEEKAPIDPNQIPDFK